MKNKFDPTKSVHFIKRNNTLFKKHFLINKFCPSLPDKILKETITKLLQKMLFFLFALR